MMGRLEYHPQIRARQATKLAKPVLDSRCKRTDAAISIRDANMSAQVAIALPFPTDENVDQVLAEFDGDPRAAIRALLHDLALLAEDHESKVSRGFVRGRMTRFTLDRSA
jgi:hypothetical protein